MTHIRWSNVPREDWPRPVSKVMKESIVSVFTQAVEILGRQFGADLQTLVRYQNVCK